MPCNAKQSTNQVLPRSEAIFVPCWASFIVKVQLRDNRWRGGDPRLRASAKLVNRKVKTNPTSLHSSFVVRWFALKSKRLMFPPVASRCHVLCAWNRRFNTKFGVARCVSSNQIAAGTRLKLQGTRVANISCSTLRSWHGCIGRRSWKRTIPTKTLQKHGR